MRGRVIRQILGRVFRPRSLRHHLVWLVVGVLAPVVLFSAMLMWRLAESHRTLAERRQIQTARDVADSLDRELASTIRALEALAQSQRLEAGDVEGFENEARRILQAQTPWASIGLRTPDGQAVIDTMVLPGKPLPEMLDPESFHRIIETRKPVIGRLIVSGRPSGIPAFPIRVIVMRGEELKYILTATIEPDALIPVVAGNQVREQEWTRTVVDTQGVVVARTRNPKATVGRSATANYMKRTRATPEGIYRDITIEGERAYVAYSRASLSDWICSVVVPVDVVDGPPRRTTLAVTGAGLIMLVISAGGAWLLSRRVASGIAAAAVAAERLSHGDPPDVPRSSIKELERLGQAMKRSAELLESRRRERAENLARAESARIEAESARSQAEAASGAKDQFLAALSHELRTPLTPALAAVQMLEDEPGLALEMRDTLGMIRRNVQLEVKLIDDLLDLTRIARGKLELHRVPVDLHLKVRQAAEICRADVTDHRQRLVLKLEAKHATVNGDSARLQQVLWNLLKNAVKFTPDEGEIRVATRDLPEDKLEVAVSDTGAGIESEALHRIFNAFEQGGASITRQFGGLGLGLTISRAIVELHGGMISAQSEGKGCGATFTLVLPVTMTPADVQPDAVDATTARNTDRPLPDGGISAASKEKLRVLLVEDNVDTAAVVARLLRRFGCTVRVANTVAAALAEAHEQQFDLLVSDLGLPDGTGYELMQTLRERFALDASRGVGKGLAISGYGMEEDVRRSLESGFAEHLTKPVDLARLKQAIQRISGRSN